MEGDFFDRLIARLRNVGLARPALRPLFAASRKLVSERIEDPLEDDDADDERAGEESPLLVAAGAIDTAWGGFLSNLLRSAHDPSPSTGLREHDSGTQEPCADDESLDAPVDGPAQAAAPVDGPAQAAAPAHAPSQRRSDEPTPGSASSSLRGGGPVVTAGSQAASLPAPPHGPSLSPTLAADAPLLASPSRVTTDLDALAIPVGPVASSAPPVPGRAQSTATISASDADERLTIGRSESNGIDEPARPVVPSNESELQSPLDTATQSTIRIPREQPATTTTNASMVEPQRVVRAGVGSGERDPIANGTDVPEICAPDGSTRPTAVMARLDPVTTVDIEARSSGAKPPALAPIESATAQPAAVAPLVADGTGPSDKSELDSRLGTAMQSLMTTPRERARDKAANGSAFVAPIEARAAAATSGERHPTQISTVAPMRADARTSGLALHPDMLRRSAPVTATGAAVDASIPTLGERQFTDRREPMDPVAAKKQLACETARSSTLRTQPSSARSEERRPFAIASAGSTASVSRDALGAIDAASGQHHPTARKRMSRAEPALNTTPPATVQAAAVMREGKVQRIAPTDVGGSEPVPTRDRETQIPARQSPITIARTAASERRALDGSVLAGSPAPSTAFSPPADRTQPAPGRAADPARATKSARPIVTAGAASGQHKSDPPTVRVWIGRLEIRAPAVTPPRPFAPSARLPRPALDLSRYLGTRR
jgi:hypothetical protein